MCGRFAHASTFETQASFASAIAAIVVASTITVHAGVGSTQTPSPDAILSTVAAIANDWRGLASAWHATVIAAVMVMWRRRPSQPTVAVLVIAPVISVSALAWWSANPFTGTLFAVLALLMAVIARRLDRTAIATGTRVEVAAGVVLTLFGLVYPHFLRAESWTEYLYASPFGLIPCPTLAVVLGVSMLFRSFGSRAWATTSAVASLIYGVIGVAVLAVWIDVLLVAGAMMLLGMTLRRNLAVR